eukprot:scaffold923_cov256-Pinguiococcus_pyrenoidosus.AAC.54
MASSLPGSPGLPLRTTKIRRPATQDGGVKIPVNQPKPARYTRSESEGDEGTRALDPKSVEDNESDEPRPPPRVHRRVSNGAAVPGLTLERREDRQPVFTVDYSNRLQVGGPEEELEKAQPSAEANTIPMRRGKLRPKPSADSQQEGEANPVLSSRRYKAQDDEAESSSAATEISSQAKPQASEGPPGQPLVPMPSNPFEAMIEREKSSGAVHEAADPKEEVAKEQGAEAVEPEVAEVPLQDATGDLLDMYNTSSADL